MIVVLRLGHRINRDKRITTHVALVARSFGAEKIILTTKDVKLEKNIESISHRFGEGFKIETGVHPKNFIKNWKGIIIHLTMYGEDIDKSIQSIDTKKDALIIVGSEKVPPYYYEIADYNVSIGNQPHSEVSALALFLDRYTKGTWKKKQFKGKIQIIPCNKGKQVISK
ncbi:MAG: tRNA (cytidine(56)-2'-O)-methyltransferase [Thermoplasmatota archaeon]